jgi:hypothetical protein
MRTAQKMPESVPAMPYFSKGRFVHGETQCQRRGAAVLAGTLAALSIWAPTTISYLSGVLRSFLRYGDGSSERTSVQHWRQYCLISLGFLIGRIVPHGQKPIPTRTGLLPIENHNQPEQIGASVREALQIM